MKYLEQDGVWFPTRIERHTGAAETGELFSTLEVHSVEFNRPEHDPELTEADAGIGVGVSVIRQDSLDARGGFWDGEKCIRYAEYIARVRSGELTPAAFVLRESARGRAEQARAAALAQLSAASQPIVTRPDSEWEAYTRRFIAHFQLDAEQSQKAWRICGECQTRARSFIERDRDAIAKIEERLAGDLPPE